MRKFLLAIALISLHFATARATDFVTVQGGRFMLHDMPYYYIGTNMWYAPILASEGEGGDRERLHRELDLLHSLGVDNLRILAGADAGSPHARSVSPVLQLPTGELNDTLLRGLDYLLREMEQRGMQAVIYLNNAWDWSGGYGHYLQRVGLPPTPASDGEGYADYVRSAAEFSRCVPAQQLYIEYVRSIVGRVNSLTGRPYSESPAIMAWQLCNEPRPFATDSATVEGFCAWIDRAARTIKSIDTQHLVSIGSEGIIGCNVDERLCQRIHANPDIDYLTLHIWPLNWRWASRDRLYESLPNVYVKSAEYINNHVRIARKLGKPMVIEEFGYARDHNFLYPGCTTTARDSFYEFIFTQLMGSAADDSTPLMGVNFWGWGGSGRPAEATWQPGADYLSDPPHEPQGWYSVYDCDSTTLQLIRRFTQKLQGRPSESN